MTSTVDNTTSTTTTTTTTTTPSIKTTKMNGCSNRLDEFDEFYKSVLKPRVLKRHESDTECLRLTIKRFEDMLDYNVPHGKKNRGMCVYESLLQIVDSGLVGHQDGSQLDQLVEQAKALGWCIEVLQASFLVADDIMDKSTMRRGQTCWYLTEKVGLNAINDSFYLLGGVYEIIQEFLASHPMYTRFYELFSQTITKTVIGQGLDLITPPSMLQSDSLCDFTNYTQQQYDSIVKWKTAYYSFCLPVRAALYLAQIDNRQVHEKCEQILLEMGHFFQIQDDFLDCYGDPRVTGKIGTDIEEAKCSWLIIQALKKCSHQQREILEKCYGRQDQTKVSSVKKVFDDLNLKSEYEKFENEAFERISSAISHLTFENESENENERGKTTDSIDNNDGDSRKAQLIRDILTSYFKKIFKRNK